MRLSGRALAWPLAVAGIGVAGTTYIALHNPHLQGATYLCPLYAATGYYCPGCGGTRAVYDLAHGDVASALSMNPLFTIAAPILIVLWVRWVLRNHGFQLREWPFPTWAGIALPALIMSFFVLRNVGPLAPLLSP